MTESVRLTVGTTHALDTAKCPKPIVALEELIWNSLDADATEVDVILHRNEIDSLDWIEVVDNGEGIEFANWKRCFGQLGDSQKLGKKLTQSGRRMHGKNGKGRLKALGLGELVTWRSRYADKDGINEFQVTGRKSFVRDFEATTPVAAQTSLDTGVTVRLENLDGATPLDNAEATVSELVQKFCLYLTKYPRICIRYDGVQVDPEANTDHKEEFKLTFDFEGRPIIAELTLIEWKKGTGAEIYLCDGEGFAIEELKSRFKKKYAHSFSAYVKSSVIEGLDIPANLSGEAKALMEHVEAVLSEYLLKREAQRACELVKTWKSENIYPYTEVSANPIEEVEKSVFDLCALNVNAYIRGFEKTSPSNKRLTFRLIKEALTQNPTKLGRILREVVALPPERQDELSNLLEKAKLSSIISASNKVINRLKFLDSLDDMIYGGISKRINEPRQLHRVLSEELWIFGDQYILGADEKGLRSVLKEHIRILGRDEIVTEGVKLLDGTDARLDLMLWTQLPTQHKKVEHLVVELKRPDCRIGVEEITQIKKYANAISADGRFNKEDTSWRFILVGKSFDEYAEQDAVSSDRPYGLLRSGNPTIMLTKWSTLIRDARYRYEFFKRELDAELNDEDGLGYLREKHSAYFADDWSVPKDSTPKIEAKKSKRRGGPGPRTAK